MVPENLAADDEARTDAFADRPWRDVQPAAAAALPPAIGVDGEPGQVAQPSRDLEPGRGAQPGNLAVPGSLPDPDDVP